MRSVSWRSEDGSAVVEMVLLTPIVIIIALAMVALGRLAQGRLDVDAAAKQAARAASLAASPYAAQIAATNASDAALRGLSPACSASSVTTSTSGFQPGGTVTVTVTCIVSLADLSLVPVGGHTSISSSFAEPLNLWVNQTGGGP